MAIEDARSVSGPDEVAAPAPAPVRGRAGWLPWAAPPAVGLLVVGGVCLLPGSYAAAATSGPRAALASAVARTAAYAATAATATPEPFTHPPRDPFRPLVGPAAVGTTNASTAPLQPGRPQPTSAPRTPPAPITSQPSPTSGRAGPAGPPGPAPARPAQPVSPVGSRHRVLSGETLWQIAVALSPSGSSIATLAARAEAIYAANAEVIGPDPSQLTSGTSLVIPPTLYAG